MSRKIAWNGAIEDTAWTDDDITPDRLQAALYGEDGSLNDDVDILINSPGGSCQAAVRMFDMLQAYPGHTTVTVSGLAASAATVFIQGADEVKMTAGSLFMIHDPMTVAMGNEADMKKAIDILRTCKASIIHQYRARSPLDEEAIAKLMSKETWMDSTQALEYGFVDSIVSAGASNSVTDLSAARAAVAAVEKRHLGMVDEEAASSAAEAAPSPEGKAEDGVTDDQEAAPKEFQGGDRKAPLVVPQDETPEEEEKEPSEEPAEESEKDPEEDADEDPEEDPEKDPEKSAEDAFRNDIAERARQWLSLHEKEGLLK